MSSTRLTKKKLANLPEEMILEILVHLPVQSLIRFKCVSKSWRSLISSSEFVESHSQMSVLSPKSERALLILNSSLHTVNCNSPKPIKTELYHPLLTAELFAPRRFVKVLGSCNGLVCILGSFDSGQRVFLYNPSTGQHRSIAIPRSPSTSGRSECWGFGFVSGVQEYRVVRQVCHSPRSREFKVQVLRLLETDEAIVGSEISCDHRGEFGSMGIFLNGSLHWLEVTVYNITPVIVRLDLARDVFDEMPVPNQLEGYGSGWYGKLGALDGCLSLLQCDGNSANFNVWAMKEYGVNSSWTMLITISRYIGPEYLHFMMPVTFHSDTKALLAIAGLKGDIVIFDSNERSFEPIHNYNNRGLWKITPYIESLVSP